LTQVPLEHSGQPVKVLHVNRAIEAELFSERLIDFGITLFAQHDRHRISRDELDDKKDD
jgi:hypothetical protein